MAGQPGDNMIWGSNIKSGDAGGESGAAGGGENIQMGIAGAEQKV